MTDVNRWEERKVESGKDTKKRWTKEWVKNEGVKRERREKCIIVAFIKQTVGPLQGNLVSPNWLLNHNYEFVAQTKALVSTYLFLQIFIV